MAAVLLAGLGFIALGTWQLQRLSWKQDLIARVDAQASAAPVALPTAAQWAAIGKPDEYRRLRVRGRFGPEQVFTQASTELGAGHWLLAPLHLEGGGVVLVNRGFVPPEQRARLAPPPAEVVELVGLLRLTEPVGGFLRRNQPEQDRWFSRDVAAIGERLKLGQGLAPFFVDEVADTQAPRRWPRPGLTVLHFNNHHAVYAATWFALAAMSLAALIRLARDARHGR